MSDNPYAPPESQPERLEEPDEQELIRRAHLNAEASIRSLGGIYLGFGILMALGSLRALFSGRFFAGEGGLLIDLLIFLLLPPVLIWMGLKLRKLNRWSAYLAGGFSTMGLYFYPVGTLINAFLLWILFCPKGRFVVRPEYREIIAATPPTIRHRLSAVTLLLLLILLIIFVSFFTNILMSLP